MTAYRAVNTDQLREKLGAQCSPMRNCSYVIGPDVNGRICHVATCRSMGEAQRMADDMNRCQTITQSDSAPM